MSDLISRQAAIDKFEPWLKVKGYNEGELNMLKAVLYELKFLPSAQPEQKKGRWLTHSDFPDRLICSECGVQFDMWHWESKQMHFCPNCGAKMEVQG